MFCDLKEICLIIEFRRTRDSKRNMIVIKSIDRLLINSIDIRFQIQWVTWYVANNVILTLLSFWNAYFHLLKCFYQVLQILNNCNKAYSNDSWIYFFDRMSKYKKILINVNCIDFKSMQTVFVYRDFCASKALFL